jgi:hypothetical protein
MPQPWSLLVASAVMAAQAAPVEAQNAKKAPGWLASYEHARAQARQSGKPIFLVFR